MKKFLSVFIIFFIFSFQVNAQYLKEVRGRAFDAITMEALKGATVSDNNPSVYSDETGAFFIHTPDTSITITFVGYKTQLVALSNQNDEVNVILESESKTLNAIIITAFESNKKLLQTAGAISVLNKNELQKNNGISIGPALNRIPGVKMEEQAPGNFKISLCGSALRDPFGVRNIKMYWEDIPLTSPDNSASHSLSFEPSQLGSIEVIKGPSGSIYGAGMGGAILFSNDKPEKNENSLAATATVGSFGLFTSSNTYKYRNEKYILSTNYTHQTYDGYRENEWGKKDAINLFGKFFSSKKRILSFILNHDKGKYGIAGSVDSSWAKNSPRKGVPFSIENKTGVPEYKYTLAGLSQRYTFNSAFSNTTSIYANFQNMDHSYGQSVFFNAFLRQSSTGYGGRTTFRYSKRIGNIKYNIIFGDEIQFEQVSAETYKLKNADMGDLLTNNRINTTSNILFAQAAIDFPVRFFLTVGGSFNNLVYNITDLKSQNNTNGNSSNKISFKPTLSPRIGLVKVFNHNLAVHGSISQGFSPPVVSEVKNPDGSFNKNLKAEYGLNYELGFRGTIINDKLSFDISTYQMNLNDALLPFFNEFGSQSFRNAGKTKQKGIEASISYSIIENKNRMVTLLKQWVNYTHNNYHFDDYIVESFNKNSQQIIKTDNSGNRITGVSPNILNVGIDFETKSGFYLNVILNYTDRTPINDLNTYYQRGYTLLASKLGYNINLKQISLNIFAGGNNLLNQKYASWISFNADANDIPPLFFNPSPAANFYTGISLKYNFKHKK